MAKQKGYKFKKIWMQANKKKKQNNETSFIRHLQGIIKNKYML